MENAWNNLGQLTVHIIAHTKRFFSKVNQRVWVLLTARYMGIHTLVPPRASTSVIEKSLLCFWVVFFFPPTCLLLALAILSTNQVPKCQGRIRDLERMRVVSSCQTLGTQLPFQSTKTCKTHCFCRDCHLKDGETTDRHWSASSDQCERNSASCRCY